VFRNLLSNAIKYSRQGGEVRIRTEIHAGKNGRVLVRVEDDGMGMKPVQVEKLFVPGKTVLTLGTSGEQGKGFGLAISKLFVEAMQGTVRVESHYDIGTAFVLDFPIPPAS